MFEKFLWNVWQAFGRFGGSFGDLFGGICDIVGQVWGDLWKETNCKNLMGNNIAKLQTLIFILRIVFFLLVLICRSPPKGFVLQQATKNYKNYPKLQNNNKQLQKIQTTYKTLHKTLQNILKQQLTQTY